MESMKTFFNDESGQGLVEYALIIAFVSIVIIAVLVTFRGSIENVFNNISGELNAPH